MPKKPDRALLLTPGASAGRDQPALVAVEKAPALVEAVREGAAELAKSTRLAPDRLVLGGRSMGGRMCSMAVAEGLPALGLALISYPLHPPGKPEKSRTEHLPSITVPCLFLSGTRDAFGTVDELETATKAVK